MKIDVELSPAFSDGLRSPHLSVELDEDDGTVQGLLGHLSKRYEGRIDSLLYERENRVILSGLMVAVNDRIFTGTALNLRPVLLRDKDKVSLLYFVSGG